MSVIRVGAVAYLNAQPLVRGLERHPDRFALRFEAPSKCAALLHENLIDVGLIPSIEYAVKPDYRIVPDVGIVSRGPVDSVALFTTRPTSELKSIALDSSSRTSVALLRILSALWFDIDPTFVTLPPDLPVMLQRCDAALLIGDVALFVDPGSAGVDKIDLGEEWTAMTGLPFVWAFWAGRPGVIDAAAAAAFREARDRGVREAEQIAREYTRGDETKTDQAIAYLRASIQFGLGEEERGGLRRFYDLASELRIVPEVGELRFYGE
jgi:chorismate dehydratase